MGHFLWFIFIGALAGWLSGKITHGKGFGLFGNIVVGILGAVLGGWLFSHMGIFLGGAFLGPLITSVFGAIILLCLIALVKRA